MPDMPSPAPPEGEPSLPERSSRTGAGGDGLLTLAAGAAIVVSLYVARAVLIPVTLAVLLSFLLAPLVHRLRRLRLGRVASAMLAGLLALGVILALAGLIGTQLAEVAGQAPQYQSIVEHKIDAIRDIATERINEFSSHFGLAPTTGPAAPAAVPPPIRISVLNLAERVLRPVVSPLLTAGIVLVVTIFILLQWEDLRERMIRLLGSDDLRRTTLALDEAGRRLSRYFLARLAVNSAYGCVIGAGLALLGVPEPVLWGVISMLLRFVPYIGPPIAALLPAALAAAIAPGWGKAIEVVALFATVEAITGNAIEPFVYGRNTGLSPFAVVVAAIFWAWIWGPIGLLLSTPLTLWAVTFARHVKRFEFLDILLGDRPALTPAERFYERLLAGDVEEEAVEAEHLLRRQTLASYYDEVVLPGSRLAASDIARGAVAPGQLARLRRAIARLIGHLPAQAAPVTPTTEASGLTMLCLAGNGPLDDFAAAMLAQLLRRHGLAARIVRRFGVKDDRASGATSSAIAAACLCYLDPQPSHATRAAVRRLRERLPDAMILLGFSSTANVPAVSASGADHVVSSLQDALASCLAEVRRRSADADRPAHGTERPRD